MVAVAVLLTLPVIVGGYPVVASDAPFHFQFYGQFARQLSGDELYPRWLMELNAGLGTPAMFVYPPVPYYLTWTLDAVLPGDADIWHQLGRGAGLAAALAGLAAHLWLRRLADRRAALAGALLYLALPYNLAVTLYVRGAYTELWSFAWAPLAFLGAELCLARTRHAVPLLALAFALLLATHIPMAFVFTLALAPIVAWRTIRSRDWRAGATVVLALGLGAGLAAIYLAPALALSGTIESVEYYRPGAPYDYADNFLDNLPPRFSLRCIIVALLAAGLTAAAWANRASRAWLCVAAAAAFMTVSASEPLWAHLPLLYRIPFPFRFVALVGLAAVVAVTLGRGAEPPGSALRRRLRKLAVTMQIVCTVAMAVLTAGWAPPDLLERRQAEAESGAANNAYWPLATFAERPALKRELIADEPRRSFLRPYLAKFGRPVSRVLDAPEGASVAVPAWTPRLIRIVTDGPGGTVVLGRLFYRGWSARADDAPCCLPVRPSTPDALIALEVPAGHREVDLRLGPLPAEVWGRLISLLALLALAGVAAAPLVRRSPPERDRRLTVELSAIVAAAALSGGLAGYWWL